MIEIVAVGVWSLAVSGVAVEAGRSLVRRRAERDRAEVASVAADWAHWFRWQAETRSTPSFGRAGLDGRRHAA
jgi:hypothetical protein